MIERTKKFLEAEYRVKVSHFTRKGFDIGNVVHVGSNDGYEIPWYFDLGAEKVIAFDPLPLAISSMYDKFRDDSRVTIMPVALSDCTGVEHLMISDGDGQGSTFLRQVNPPYVFSKTVAAPVVRFDSLHIDLAGFRTLVVDTQGMELQVLKGFGDRLQEFDFLNIECSNPPQYENSASADEVISFLSNAGFDQDSEMVVHDDIMFVKRGIR